MRPDEAAMFARAQLDSWLAGVKRKAEQDQKLAERVQSLTGTVTSHHGEVTATVDCGGRPTALEISSRGMALRPEDLAALIVKTFRQAGAVVGVQVKEAVNESWGASHPLAQHTASSYDVFGPPPEEPTPPAPSPFYTFGAPRFQRSERPWQ